MGFKGNWLGCSKDWVRFSGCWSGLSGLVRLMVFSGDLDGFWLGCWAWLFGVGFLFFRDSGLVRLKVFSRDLDWVLSQGLGFAGLGTKGVSDIYRFLLLDTDRTKMGIISQPFLAFRFNAWFCRFLGLIAR